MKCYGFVSYERNLITNSYEEIRKLAAVSSSAKYRSFELESQAANFVQSRGYGYREVYGNKVHIYPNKFYVYIEINITPEAIILSTEKMLDLKLEIKGFYQIGRNKFAKQLPEVSTSSQVNGLLEVLKELYFYPLDIVTTNVLLVSLLRDSIIRHELCTEIHKVLNEMNIQFALTLEIKE